LVRPEALEQVAPRDASLRAVQHGIDEFAVADLDRGLITRRQAAHVICG
jgi:hypothetical protein